MPGIRLIHWNAAEAAERAEQIRLLGYQVSPDLPAGPDFLRQLRLEPPLAVVIDLGRLPSQGRDMGVAIRHAAATRRVPLVFVGGAPDKIGQARSVLPDATFTTWERIGEDLAAAIRNPPAQPIVPESTMAGYSGRPLVKKLGIKPGMRIALYDPPEGFAGLPGELPPGAAFQARGTGPAAGADPNAEAGQGPCGLVIWFVRSRAGLARDLASISDAAGDAPLWIAWPKKSSLLRSDVGEADVRGAGLASGLVDYKICAIDATWSGLLFRRRR
jgi:hypothetical protein